MAEHEAAVAADAVDRVLGPVDELHHEQRREVVGADRLERLVDRQRQRAGAGLEQRVAPVDVAERMRKPREPLAVGGFMQTSRSG